MMRLALTLAAIAGLGVGVIVYALVRIMLCERAQSQWQDRCDVR